MKKLPRDAHLERILDRQARLWESERISHQPESAPVRPNVTLARGPYSGSEELAQRLASRLGWELYDHCIVDSLHEDDELGKSVIEALDEHLLNYREDWLYHLFVPGHTATSAYLGRLSRLIFSIAMRGHAVILGRGATWILPPRYRLAVLAVRSFESRLQRYMAQHGGGHEAARRELLHLDREHGEFVLRSFHRHVGDPESYDVCVNMDALGLEAAEEIVVKSLHVRFPHLREAPKP